MKICKVPIGDSGCCYAPELIVKSLKKIEMNESGNRIVFEERAVETAAKIIQPEIIIGGDHSVTYYGVKSINAKLIVFDAHADCGGTMVNNNYLRRILEDRILRPQDVIIVGLRKMLSGELAFIKNNNIMNFDMRRVYGLGMEEMTDIIMENSRSYENIYVSIDIDVIDPSMAPGTDRTEPGGISSRDLIYFIQRLKFLRNKKIYDVVEVNPKKDVNNMTVELAAKLVSEIF